MMIKYAALPLFLLAPLFPTLSHGAAVVSSLSMKQPIVGEEEEDYNILYPMLGKNSLDELNFAYNVEVDEDSCDYTMTVSFQHNPIFPMGGPDTCLPSLISDYDGLNMLEGRWFYEQFPDYVAEATSINHVSVDWNPCGHPGPGFLIPHYDLHFYRVSPEFRVFDMNCEVIAGTPACWPDQYIEEGQKFFQLDLDSSGNYIKNLPKGYEFHPEDVVIHMGSHILETSTVPSTPAEWINPTYIIGTYDSNVVFIEPMLPTHYFSGTESQSYTRDLEYTEQDDVTLPFQYSVEYNGGNEDNEGDEEESNTVTIVFRGKSTMCKAEFETAKVEYEAFVSRQQQRQSGAVAGPRGGKNMLLSLLLVVVAGTTSLVATWLL